MITGVLISGVFAALYAITSPFRLLSDVSLPSGITDAVLYINGFLSGLDPFLPLSTMITILGLVFAIEIVIIGYRVVMWVITKIPGISN